MNVEHLWFSTKSTEKNMHNASSLDMAQSDLPEENMIQTLTNMADKRLFKLVKWCKSLPLFKNILVITIWSFELDKKFHSMYVFHILWILQIDDQISLLINAWCELLVFSCCFRSIGTPVSHNTFFWLVENWIWIKFYLYILGNHTRFKWKLSRFGQSKGRRHRQMDWENAQFHGTITTSQSWSLRICQHEGHCPSYLR